MDLFLWPGDYALCKHGHEAKVGHHVLLAPCGGSGGFLPGVLPCHGHLASVPRDGGSLDPHAGAGPPVPVLLLCSPEWAGGGCMLRVESWQMMDYR